jgi:pyrroloquinoline quinone biosynthesis protein D
MKVRRNPDILWREEDESRDQAYAGLMKGEDVADVGTSVLYSDGVMLSVNILGTEIWKLCDGRGVEEIVSELMERFDVAEEVLLRDVGSFLSELEEKGFILYEDR